MKNDLNFDNLFKGQTIECTCPSCSNVIAITLTANSTKCPNCKTNIKLDFDKSNIDKPLKSFEKSLKKISK